MITGTDNLGESADQPLVSCVTIFLNGEDYIRAAIESVVAQSYKNWELILVDDGSTDGATAIAQEFAERYPDRIRYTEHPGHENRGMSASRNAGVQLAKGTYVTFLDADDIWLPDRLATHVAVMERNPTAGMCIAPTLLWSSWNKRNAPFYRPWLAADFETNLAVPTGELLEPPRAATMHLLSHGSGMPGVNSLTIRRECLLKTGGSEESFRTLYEDQVMIFKMFLHYPVIAIDEIRDKYRQHDASACAQEGRIEGDQKMRPVFLGWLEAYIEECGITDAALWDALRSERDRREEPASRTWRDWPHIIVDHWNFETRLAVIWLLTPKRYHQLRQFFGRS